MKIAILSDIHGNKIALDAALEDIEAVGVDEYWVLGDIVALGPDPVGVSQRLATLQNCHMIRGNTDRYVVTGDRPPPFLQDLNADVEKISAFAEITATFAWTQGAVTAAGWFDWLSKLPLEIQKVLPDGTQCLLVHASPGKDDGPGMGKDTSDIDISKLLKETATDLICVGHTHQAFDRKVEKWRILNPGSISNPLPPVLQASYMILDVSMNGYHVEHRKVDYDRDQVISQVQAIKHPGADFIIKRMRGLP